MFKNTKLNKTYNFILRFVIISGSYSYIAFQLFDNENYKKSLSFFYIKNSEFYSFFLFLFVFFLMLLNWSIEAYKWRYLIGKIEKISYFKAVKAILAGLSVSTFTPNRIGEFLGRVFILKKSNPWKAIFISTLCSMSQLIITILIGSISLVIYIFKYILTSDFIPAYVLYGFIFLLIIINLIFISLFFNVSFLSKFIVHFIPSKWRKIKNYFKVFSYFKFYELRNTLMMSFLRYIVFSFQFFLLLRFFGLPISFFEGIFLISLIYFIISAIPSIALAELGIRGSVAVGVFSYYYNTSLNLNCNFNFEVIAATSMLWIINLALPAFIGNIFVLKLKFFKE